MDDYHTQMKWAELALALKFPVFEVEYQLERNNDPLKLYDCFIPRLKEYMKSKPAYADKHFQDQERLRKEEQSMINMYKQEA